MSLLYSATALAGIIPSMPAVDMGSNPLVQIGMVILNLILGAVGFIVIAAGIINLLFAIMHAFTGKHEKIRAGAIVGPEIGGAGRIGIVALELVIGVVLVGFVLTGSWTAPINSIVDFGKILGSKLTAGLQTATPTN